MIAGDPGRRKRVPLGRRGKGGLARPAPADQGPFIRGSGVEGVGVHLLTGPVAIENAEPGGPSSKCASLNVRHAELFTPVMPGAVSAQRPANWGFHYHDLIEETKRAK